MHAVSGDVLSTVSSGYMSMPVFPLGGAFLSKCEYVDLAIIACFTDRYFSRQVDTFLGGRICQAALGSA